jgi:hypothetical protein
LKGIHESCPDFVIFQLECQGADLGDEHLRFYDFTLPQAFPIRRQKGQKDLLEFHREFLQAPTPMAEGDCGKARLSPGGRGNGEVKRRKRCVGADAVCCVLFILPRFRH